MALMEARDHDDVFRSHAFEEQLVDLGEIRMNYAAAGKPDAPPLLLIPGQGQSWWSYEAVMALFAERHRVYAVDLRGQGRSTWTPGRYTLDNMGNDLVRFLDRVVGRPTIVSGLSSGGVLSTWLAAYAMPGQVRAAVLEDPPLFASEVDPAVGHSLRQAVGPQFAVLAKWLGDQWSIGDLEGMQAAFPKEVPEVLLRGMVKMGGDDAGSALGETIREYDPEWARSFVSGLVTRGCDHLTMLQQVKVPVLFTHHYREVDEDTNHLLGAISDVQAAAVRRTVEAAGQPFTYRSFPDMPHTMHQADPALFVATVSKWIDSLDV